MLCRFVLHAWLASCAQAFGPGPIRWGGLPARNYVLAPQLLSHKASFRSRAAMSPQNLMIWDRPGTVSPDDVPFFIQMNDKTITWVGTDLCLEAGGDEKGDVIRVNHCTGKSNQLWNLLPNGRQKQIQLQGSSLCVDVNDESGLNAAPAELRECDRNKMAKSWKIDWLRLPTQGPAQNPSAPFSHVDAKHPNLGQHPEYRDFKLGFASIVVVILLTRIALAIRRRATHARSGDEAGHVEQEMLNKTINDHIDRHGTLGRGHFPRVAKHHTCVSMSMQATNDVLDDSRLSGAQDKLGDEEVLSAGQRSSAKFTRRSRVFMQLTCTSDSTARPLMTGWDFWHQLGAPKTVCAPMVDQSELAFRLLCRELGTDLAYTPMIHARLFDECDAYRKLHFDPHPCDRPVIAQLAGHDPDVVLAAARRIEASGLVDAIDLNFGCPQRIARRGRYGAFLLDEPDVMVSLVSRLAGELNIPVTAKLRLLPSRPASIELCKRLEEAGASAIALHGRTREQNKQLCGSADWDSIREAVRALTIPVIANGGIATKRDVDACMEYTGCAAVMSSEALLENPGLFCANIHPITGVYLDQHALARRYLEICEEHLPSKGISIARAHLMKFLHAGLQCHTEIRDELLIAGSLAELREIVERLSVLGWDMPNFHNPDPTKENSELSWYERHRYAVNRQNSDAPTTTLSREEIQAAFLAKREKKREMKANRRRARKRFREKKLEMKRQDEK